MNLLFRMYWGINYKFLVPRSVYHVKTVHARICITCTVHRTAMSIEHLASGGFYRFIAFRERNNFIRLS